LIVAIAVAVTIIALPASGPITFGQGLLAGAAGSAASQAVGLATGIQDKFDFKGLALSALAGGITAGIGPEGKLFGLKTGANGLFGKGLLAAAGRGMLSSALTQGIGVATGLQDKFNWAGVAAAGIGAGVGAWANANWGLSGFDAKVVSGMAGGIAGAAATSLVTGQDFGDTIMAQLPSIIGNTIGNIVAAKIASIGAPKTSGDPRLAYADVGSDDSVTAGGSGQGGAALSQDMQTVERFISQAEYDDVVARARSAQAAPASSQAGAQSFIIASGSLTGTTTDNIVPTWQDAARFYDGKFGYLEGRTDGSAVFVRLHAIEAMADAATLDLTRSVIAPLDLGLSVSSIVHGNGSTGDYINVGATLIPGVGKAAGKLLTGETTIARAARLGREGERAAGVVGPKSGILINGRMRFPDEITPTTIKEVKNVGRQGWTSQLRDYADLARSEGKTFELWVRQNTQISRNLRAAEIRGDVIIKKELPRR